MDISQQLKVEIEAAAKALDIAPSTVGERAGQGGRFYKRLCDGKRVWPETAQAVRARIHEMTSGLNEAREVLACPQDVATSASDCKRGAA